MNKFFAGILYTVGTGIASVVAFQHTQGIPTTSGWMAFITMIVLPQVTILIAYGMTRKVEEMDDEAS